MGNEGRARFPSRTAGIPDVSLGSARKKAKQRDHGEKVAVAQPQVSSPRKSAVRKHQPTDGAK